MGTDIADINNDGLEDILVMDMLPEDYKRSKISVPSVTQESFWAAIDSGFHKQYMHNVLHLNQGNMFFSEGSQLAAGKHPKLSGSFRCGGSGQKT